jgi:putative hydrolase of the HAD superfamily
MEVLSGIKNIVFDLGMVLLNLDTRKTIDAFAQLGISGMMSEKGFVYDHEIFYLMEKGKLSPEEFRSGVRKLIPGSVSDQQIDDAWNAMLLDFPANRVELVKKLRPQYHLYLFSNTNAIHVEKFESDFRQLHKFEVAELFEQIFYSNEIGFRKPAHEAFYEIIRLSGIDAGESLFIDDLLPNVEAAIACGFKGLWLEPEQAIEEIFEHLK